MIRNFTDIKCIEQLLNQYAKKSIHYSNAKPSEKGTTAVQTLMKNTDL